MKSKILVAAAGLASLLVASWTHAATYDFSYQFRSGETLTGQVTGTLQSDNDTVLVDQLLNSTYSGDPLQEFSTELLPFDPPFKQGSLSGEGVSLGTGAPTFTGLGGWLFNSILIPDAAIVALPDGLGGNTFAEDEPFAPENWSMTIVPIPAAIWLFGSALGLLGWMRRKAA